MALPVVYGILYYAPESTLIQLESLKMIIQDADYAYLVDIHDSNKYLLEYHTQLVLHITGLLQDHSMSPVDLSYTLTNTSSFTTSLPYDIPPNRPTSVPTSAHINYKSELPSIFPSSFPSNISSDKSI